VLASSVSDRRLVDAGLEFLEDRGLAPRALIFNRVNPYYLEDVRQQRIIRNLAEPRSPVDDLLAFFRRFAKPSGDQSGQQEQTSEALPVADEDVSLQDEEAIPDFIGEEEIEPEGDEFQQEELPLPELIGEETVESEPGESDKSENTELPEHIEEEQDEKNPGADEASESSEEPEEISFKKWFSDPNTRQAKKPGKESEDDAK
jgi:hypothetical protein